MNILPNTLIKILPLVISILLLVPTLTFAQGMNGVQTMMFGLVSGVFGFFAGLAGMLLNVGINVFVIGFGKLYTTGGLGAAVDLAWVSVRDIFNITFIFGLIYIGFKMILNSDDSSTRRWLINLIMAAILVNFSLFFTKFIVDLSNIAASEVAIAGFGQDDAGQVKVSDKFADAIGFGTLFSNKPNVEGKTATDQIPEKGGWGYIFGTMIILLIATFVFAAGGLLLIIRAAVLCVYLVLSPLMFIGWVFPQLQRYTSEYWSGFLGRAFFAPIYILLIYLSAQIIDSYRNSLGFDPNLSGLLNGGGAQAEVGFVSSLTPFILASVFLVASIVIANKMGAHGASAAVSTGKNLSNRLRRGVGNVTVGTSASIARNTAGRAANAYASSDYGKRKAANSFVGRQLYGAASGVAGASFDARNVAGVGKALKIGEGSKGGFNKTVEDRKKAEEKFAKNLGEEEIKNEDGTYKAEFKTQIEEGVQKDEKVVATKQKSESAKLAHQEKESEIKKITDSVDPKKVATIKEISDLEQQEKEALASGDGNAANHIKNQIDTRKKDLSEQEKELANKLAPLQAASKEAAALAKNAEAEAKRAEKEARSIEESKAIYSRQLAYIKQLEASSKTWGVGSPVGVAVTGAAGAVIGAATIGLGISAPVALAGSAVGSRSSYAAEHLTRLYGKDGRKAVKNKKKRDDLKILSEEMKDLDSSDDSSSPKSTTPAPTSDTEE